jgi:hypothetical protein
MADNRSERFYLASQPCDFRSVEGDLRVFQKFGIEQSFDLSPQTGDGCSAAVD